jgi:hypothetical protein
MYKSFTDNYENKKLLFIEKFTSTLLIVFVISVFYHFFFHGYYLSSPWPLNSIFQPSNKFANDFTRMIELSSELNPYEKMRNIFPNEVNPYFFLSYIYFYSLSLLSKKISVNVIYCLYCIIFTVVFALINLKYFSIKKYGFKPFFIATFLSFPFLFLIDRGNIESLIFIFLYLGLFFYYQKQNLYLSSFFLVLATALKPYFGIFFVLYLWDKKFKAFFYSAIFGILLILICIFFLKGNLYYNFNGFLIELKMLSDFCFSDKSNCNNLSLKVPFSLNSPRFYSIFCLLFFLTTMILHYFLKFKRMQIITMICLITYFIPMLSNQYKLMTLFIPIYYLIDQIEDESIDSINFYGIVFGLILSCIYITPIFQLLFLKWLMILLYIKLIYYRLIEIDFIKLLIKNKKINDQI